MKIFKYLLLFITFLNAHNNCLMDEDEKVYVKNKKVLNVCINPDWAPIEFREGEPKGISIDILKHITNKIGLKLNFVNTKSWSESQKYLKDGKCDLTPTAVKTSKREKYAIFTKPYLTYDLAIITTQDKPYITNLNAIINKIITRKKGSGVITKLRKKYPNIDIIEADSYKQMFELVSYQKAYATIATLPVFAYYQKKYNLKNLKIAGFTGWKYNLRMMINKKEITLRHILDKELSLITPKTTQQIYEKWIVKTKPQIDYKKLIKIIIIFIIILLVILVWVYILHQKNKELKRLAEVKNQFLENMSHEIRTPLNAIIGFIQIAKKDPKKCQEYLDVMDGASQTLLSIIDDILNFSRLQKENLDVKNEKFDTSLLSDVVKFYKSIIEKKGLQISFDIDLPRYLKGDVEKLKNVLVHILDNAVKFTKDGEIEVILKYKNDKLFISIKDTGIGISEKNLEKIFEPFIQLDNRINKEFSGTGIGLSVSKKFVEAMGGVLEVSSKKGEGSRFYFEIPIEKIETNNSKMKISGKILIVEDNKANQMFMKVLLKQLGLEYDLAQNGLEAVDMYKKHHYPVILMDINMPVMDGITATKEIRKYEKENNLNPSKIIAVTAQAIDGDDEKFTQIMDGYIPKPVDLEKLKNAL